MNAPLIFVVGLLAGGIAGGLFGVRRGLDAGSVGTTSEITLHVHEAGQKTKGVTAAHDGGVGLSKNATRSGNVVSASSETELTKMLMNKGSWDEKGVNALLDKKTETELAEIIAAATRNKGAPNAEAMKHAAYRAWVRKHPEAALAQAGRESVVEDRLLFTGTVFSEWAKHAPMTAIQAGIQLQDLPLRNLALSRVVSQWAQDDQEGVLMYLAEHPETPDMMTLIFNVFPAFSKTGQHDFGGQLTLAQRYTSGSIRQNLVRNLVQFWARTDPAAALAYVQSIDDVPLRESAIWGAHYNWAGTNLPAALKSAETLTDPSMRGKALEGVFSQWMGFDPLAAADYILKSGSPENLEHLVRLSHNMADDFTVQESDSLLKRIPEGGVRQQMVKIMARELTQNGDYVRAVGMLELMTDGKQRSAALFDIGKRWGDIEPARVADWLGGFSPSPERDAAMTGYVASVAKQNPAEALRLAASLRDPQSLQTARMNIAFQWLRKSPAEAQAWMTSVGFSSKDRELVKEAMSRSRSNVFNSPTGYGSN